MQRKGQAEFALILGLIVIIAVVAVYGISTISPPTVEQSAMTEGQKAVASFATDLVRDATSNTINELYRNGGYLEGDVLPMGYVDHAGFGKVPYWQMCENYQAPDLEANLKMGIENYIKKHLSDTETIDGKAAVFTKSALDVQLVTYGNRVSVAVNLPTVYEGASLQQPYMADVYTKFGRLSEFAENFAMMQADLRLLDHHLIKSLGQSSEYSSCWIPFGMGNANRPYTFTWLELKNCMEEHIKYSLSNTQIGREVPITDDDNEYIASFNYNGWRGSASEFFFVPGVNIYDPITGQLTGSDRFNDLKISFYFGDENGLDNTEFSAPEILDISARTGAFTQYFYGLISIMEYTQTYSVKYPVIVNVWDESTRSSLQFATYVYMEDNTIGSGCIAPPTLPEPSYGEGQESLGERCQDGATEDAFVTIEYENGEPVTNVPVYYGGCNLGLTDQAGSVRARIYPEMLADLTVQADGNYFSECHSYEGMSLVTMTIPKSRIVNFIFKKVPITKDVGTNIYSMSVPITVESSDFVSVEMSRYDNICDAGTVVAANLADDATITKTNMLRIPVGEYSGTVITREGGMITGMVTFDSYTPSGNEIYVYAPSMEGFEDQADLGAEAENIKSLFENCGITSSLSDNFQSAGGCEWTII